MAAIDKAAINELAAAIRFHDGNNTMGAGALAEVLVAIGVRGPAAITAALDGLDADIDSGAFAPFSIGLAGRSVATATASRLRRALLGEVPTEEERHG